MNPSELSSWLGRYDECLRLLLEAPTGVHREVAENRARECRRQFNAYRDARPTERGFVDLCGLAEA